MYEGKNIHHSNTDNKLLCSFSGKLCNQRRLNGYGFCVRHILEDPTAPFKRCAYVAKSSNQMCTQAIPKNEDRRYCNNHMQVLGMLPKKERKKKDKMSPIVSSLSESGLLLPNGGLAMKPKFSLSVNKDGPSSRSTTTLQLNSSSASSVGDSDDPYAFSDSVSLEAGNKLGVVTASSLSATIDSVLGKSLQSGTGFVRSASDIGGSASTSTLGSMSAGGSMIAKYYPELAEKLEKMRAAKPEPKVSPKSRAKSSRTMNKLQTKIAQNRINEKLRKSQELNLSQTDSNSSPIQLSSPEAGGIIVDQSPGSSPAASTFSPNISSLSYSPQSTTTGFYQPSPVATNLISSFEMGQQPQQQRGQEVPPLPQVDTSLLATLATHDNMGFQTTEGECNVGSVNVVNNSAASSRLLPPRLPPPPYPGSSVLSQQPSALTPSDIASAASIAFGSPQHNVNTVIDNSSTSASLSARLHQHLQQQQQNLLSTITTTAAAAAATVKGIVAAGSTFSTATTSVSSLPFTPPVSISNQHLSKIATPLFLSPTSTNPALAFSPSLSSSSNSLDHHHHHVTADHNNVIKTLPNHHLSSLPQLASSSTITNSADILSLLNNINRKPLTVDTKSSSSSQHLVSTIPSPNTVAAQLSLPPPPPYVLPKVSSSSMASLSSSSLLTTSSSSSSSSSATNLAVPMPIPPPRARQQNVRPVLVTSTVPHMKLRKLKGVLDEKEALAKLRTKSAAKYYSLYAGQKMSNHSLVSTHLCSSDEDSVDEDSDLLPWQPDHFSASSDDQDDDEDDEFDTSVPMSMRPTKLSLRKTRLRRQWHQARQAYRSNQTTAKSRNQATLALIQTVRESGACAVKALWHIRHIKKSKKKLRKLLPKKKKTCCHKNSTDGPCTNPCLPYTNHCLRHIMYNIDQQIFDYCTAKFADNTQCCMPVFDIRHELPLCPVHAAKADNYQKQMELENKKKPRKKSKPAALTRPPRKGKKKKKGRYSRQQKAQSAAEAASGGLDSTLSDIDVLGVDTPSSQAQDTDDPSTAAIDVVSTGGDDKPVASSSASTADAAAHRQTNSSSTSTSSSLTATASSSVKTTRASSSITSHQMEQALELEETLSPDFDKQFELPLEQASRLLDESDFTEVVNKMPFEALDLFGKQGDGDQEETDQIPLDQVSANKARDTIEKLLCGAMSEEESMQLAMVLAQNLHTDAELAQNAVALLTTDGSTGGGGASSGGGAVAGNTPSSSGMLTSLESGVGTTTIATSISSHSTGGVNPMDIQVHQQQQQFVVQGPTNVTIDNHHQLRQQQHRQNQQQHQQQHHLLSSHPAMHSAGGFSSSSSSSIAPRPLPSSSPAQQVQFDRALSAHHVVTTSPSSSLSSSPHPQRTSTSSSQAVYGQIDPFVSQQTSSVNQNLLLQRQQQQQQSQSQNPASYSGYVPKTVVRHLPTDTVLSQRGRIAGSAIINQSTVSGLNVALGAGDGSPSSKILAGNVKAQSTIASSNTVLVADRKDSSKISALTLASPKRNVDFSLQRDLRIERPLSTSLPTSSSSSVLSSSLSLPSLAKKAKLSDGSTLSPASVMQQQQQLLQQSSNTNLLSKQQQSLEQNLQIKHLKQQQQQQQHLHQLQSPLQQQTHLSSSSSPMKSGHQRLNFMEPCSPARSPTPNMIKLSKQQLPPSPSPGGVDQNSLREKLPHPHSNMGSPKLKLLPPKSSLSPSDITNTSNAPGGAVLNTLTLPTKRKSHSPATPSSLSVSSSISSSSSSVLLFPHDSSVSTSTATIIPTTSTTATTTMYKGIGAVLSTTPNSALRYSITANNNSSNNNGGAGSSSGAFPSSLQKSLNLTADDDDDSPSESISVTVRHPSSLEAVPTTVRHTLPDTFPTPDSLPSSPLQLLPKSSSVVNSPTRSLTSSPAPQQSASASSSPQPHRLSLDLSSSSSSNHFKQFKSLSSHSPSSSASSSSSSSSSDLHSVLSSQLQRNSQWTPSPPPPLLPHTHTHNQQQHTPAGLTNGGLPSLNSPLPKHKSNSNSINKESSSASSSLSSVSSSPLVAKLNLTATQPSSHYHHHHHHHHHHPQHQQSSSTTLSPHTSNLNPSARKLSSTNSAGLSSLSHHPVVGGSASGLVGTKQLHVQQGAMPVVCNAAAVTMSKFTPPLPATAFKTSGTS